MTISEIYDAIVAEHLYTFKADRPSHVVASQIRRHCKGLDFPSASPTKHFEVVEGDKYRRLSRVVRNPSTEDLPTESSVKQRGPSAYSILRQINLLRDEYEKQVRSKMLRELRKLDPTQFEHFCRRLLDVYGFTETNVTRAHKDGGIDGYGKLKVGFTSMNVAFQSKRWARTAVGRPEIDKFRGAIQGDYEQGIFFTTSSFASGAEAVSFKPGAVPIILIDGASIVDIMIDKQFGVQVESIPIPNYALDLALADPN